MLPAEGIVFLRDFYISMGDILKQSSDVGHGFIRAVFKIDYGFRETHSVGFPRKNHPPEDFFSLPTALVYKSISLTAVSDQGSAFGFRKPLKRLDRNFQFRRSRLFAFSTASMNACPTESSENHPVGHGKTCHAHNYCHKMQKPAPDEITRRMQARLI